MFSSKDLKKDAFSTKLRGFNKPQTVDPSAMVYLTTNEEGDDKVIATLKDAPPVSFGFHIGFSGMHNLNIMAARKSTGGLICDINPQNTLFFEILFKMILEEQNRIQFIENLKNFVKKEEKAFTESLYGKKISHIKFSPNMKDSLIHYDSQVKILEHEAKNPSAWFSNDDSYHFIRALVAKDKIAVININICDSSEFLKIMKLLEGNFFEVDSLYLSNIAEWMTKPEDKAKFLETVKCFAKENTFVIDGRPRAGLPQKVSFAKNVTDWDAVFFEGSSKPIPVRHSETRSTSSKNPYSFWLKAGLVVAGISVGVALYNINTSNQAPRNP